MPVHAILTSLFESIKIWIETLIYLDMGIIARIVAFTCIVFGGFICKLTDNLQQKCLYPLYPLRG